MIYRGILASLCILAAASSAPAQATSETAYQTVRLQVFGVGNYVKPSYGPSTNGGYGFAVGGGIGASIPHVHHVEPSLDVRYTLGSNTSVTQSTFGGGLRVAVHAAHFHPYGDFLVGKGNITFKYAPFAGTKDDHNDSLVWTYGGGLDYDLSPTWAIRADVQQQDWKLSAGDPAFHPIQAGIGIRYQFRFRNRFDPE